MLMFIKFIIGGSRKVEQICTDANSWQI